MKITATRVREIVNEELARARSQKLTELTAGPDHKATAAVVSAASKLLAALEAFDKATENLPAAKSSTQTDVDALRRSLAHMVEAPTSYAKQPSEPRVIKLRPQKDGGTL